MLRESVLLPHIFDIILMDIRMPVLDGLDATKAIRGLTAGGVRPYIVAVSANALKGDRESYLAAGLDDCISKPVRTDTLNAIIHHFKQVRA
nr:response regulator [Gorillibacterium massiliense]